MLIYIVFFTVYDSIASLSQSFENHYFQNLCLDMNKNQTPWSRIVNYTLTFGYLIPFDSSYTKMLTFKCT